MQLSYLKKRNKHKKWNGGSPRLGLSGDSVGAEKDREELSECSELSSDYKLYSNCMCVFTLQLDLAECYSLWRAENVCYWALMMNKRRRTDHTGRSYLCCCIVKKHISRRKLGNLSNFDHLWVKQTFVVPWPATAAVSWLIMLIPFSNERPGCYD